MSKYRLGRKAARAAVTAAAVIFMTAQLSGCKEETGQNYQQTDNEETQQEENPQNPSRPQEENESMPGGSGRQRDRSAQEPEGSGMAGDYALEDLDDQWSEEKSTIITLEGSGGKINGNGAALEEGIIRITAAGTYVLRGSFEGQIVVDAGKEDVVRMVLDGVTLSNDTSSCIYGLQSSKIILILAEGTENTVSDGKEYVFEEEEQDEPDAAVFSKDDLTIVGAGTLQVNGNYSNGIRSKDDLKVISGKLVINAVKDGLKGKDSVTIKDGTIEIVSDEDGIKSNEDSDPEKGYVIIDGGTIDIQVGDDGIHAETWLTINGGIINIRESNEGIEGLKVDINGGDIRVKSTDDGINAAGGSSDQEADKRSGMEVNEEAYIRIAAGIVQVDAGGDGLDSNGNIFVKGGTLFVSGPEGSGDAALDYNGGAMVSGGTVAMASSAGMMETFSESSSQPMFMVYYESAQEAGSSVVLTDLAGNTVLEYAPEKAFSCILLSAPQLEDGGTYKLTTGTESQEIVASGILTVVGERPAGRGMGHGGFGGGRPENGGMPGREAGGPEDGSSREMPGDGKGGNGRGRFGAEENGAERKDPGRRGDGAGREMPEPQAAEEPTEAGETVQ